MFNTLKQFSTNSKPLLLSNILSRLSTHYHSVVCLPLKEQSHKDLQILRMNAHDMQQIIRNRCRSSILQLRYLV